MYKYVATCGKKKRVQYSLRGRILQMRRKLVPTWVPGNWNVRNAEGKTKFGLYRVKQNAHTTYDR